MSIAANASSILLDDNNSVRAKRCRRSTSDKYRQFCQFSIYQNRHHSTSSHTNRCRWFDIQDKDCLCSLSKDDDADSLSWHNVSEPAGVVRVLSRHHVKHLWQEISRCRNLASVSTDSYGVLCRTAGSLHDKSHRILSSTWTGLHVGVVDAESDTGQGPRLGRIDLCIE